MFRSSRNHPNDVRSNMNAMIQLQLVKEKCIKEIHARYPETKAKQFADVRDLANGTEYHLPISGTVYPEFNEVYEILLKHDFEVIQK
jgi:hypothetical protein